MQQGDNSQLSADMRTVNLHITVRDSGIGIPADKIDLIFRSFSQVTLYTSPRDAGLDWLSASS